MTVRRLVVRPSALHYAENAGERIAERFLAAVDGSIAAVVEAPESWPVAIAKTRKYPVYVQDASFQYILYYRLTPSEIIVLAVLHGARAPGTWRRRM